MPRLVAIPSAAVLLWSLVVFGSYKIVERAFLVDGAGVHRLPDRRGARPPELGQRRARTGGADGAATRSAACELVIAIIGTTITPYMQLYLQSTVAEKAVRPEDYVYERIDVIAGSVFANVVALAIMVATAATLFSARHRR